MACHSFDSSQIVNTTPAAVRIGAVMLTTCPENQLAATASATRVGVVDGTMPVRSPSIYEKLAGPGMSHLGHAVAIIATDPVCALAREKPGLFYGTAVLGVDNETAGCLILYANAQRS